MTGQALDPGVMTTRRRTARRRMWARWTRDASGGAAGRRWDQRRFSPNIGKAIIHACWLVELKIITTLRAIAAMSQAQIPSFFAIVPYSSCYIDRSYHTVPVYRISFRSNTWKVVIKRNLAATVNSFIYKVWSTQPSTAWFGKFQGGHYHYTVTSYCLGCDFQTRHHQNASTRRWHTRR